MNVRKKYLYVIICKDMLNYHYLLYNTNDRMAYLTLEGGDNLNFTREEYIQIAAESVTKLVKEGFAGIVDKGKGTYKKFLVATESIFPKYYDTAIRKYSSLKSIINRTEVYYLYDIYVNIFIENNKGKIDTSNILNILKVSNATIITGMGGSGKSTLLKHLFLNCLKLNAYVPFFIELRDINGMEVSERLEISLHKLLNDTNLNLDYNHFCYALEKCDTILFLDGFDELEDDKAQQVAKGIQDLFSRYEKIKVFVTSRPCEQQFISWNNFNEFKVCPLRKNEALELIKKINYSSETKSRFLSDLEDKLFDLHRSFASNPLLLTIMLLTYGDYAEIPSKIHMFYEEAFEVLFRKHDSIKGMALRTLKTDLAKDDFERILSAFSFISYIETKYDFRRKELIEYLEKAKELINAEFSVENYLTDLQEAVCIIQLEGLLYSYTHRSFQEYFTALYILRSSKEQRKIIFNMMPARAIKKDNVIELLYDMNKDIVETELVIPILKKIKRETKYGIVDEDESFKIFLKLYTDSIMLMDIMPNNSTTKKRLAFGYHMKYNTKSELIIDTMFFILMKRNIRDKYAIASNIYKELAKEVKRLGCSEYIEVNMSIDEFCNNEKMFNLHKKYGGWRDAYVHAMNLIDVLEKEYKEKKESLLGALIASKKKRAQDLF